MAVAASAGGGKGLNLDAISRMQTLIAQVQSVMIAYVTGGRTPDQPNRYGQLAEELDSLFTLLSIKNPNPHATLEEFAGFCRLRHLDSYGSRSLYVENLYQRILNRVFPRQEEEVQDEPSSKPTTHEPIQNHTSHEEKVFVVHGRNKTINRGFFDFLRSLGLEPIEWSQAVEATGEGSPYIGDILENAFSSAQAIVILMTPDDEVRLKPALQDPDEDEHEKTLTGQPRPNVLFEAGMAFGRNPRRTVIVQVGNVKSFSDIQGRHVVRLTNAPERRREIANRLRTAGCSVDDTGTDWLSGGNFDLQDDGEDSSQEPAKTELVFQENAIRVVRELLVRYRTERDCDPIVIDGGKGIVEQALDTIHEFLSQIDEKEHGTLHAKLTSLAGLFARLMRHDLYIDGGQSFRQFWLNADEAFEELRNLMELKHSDL